MKTKITIAVTDFALPSPRKGSIDAYSGFSLGQSFGIDIHQQVQQQRAKADRLYQAEVIANHKFKVDKFVFEVIGRMDGVYHTEKFKIEEIKTGFDLNKLFNAIKENEEYHPYCLQLKTYGYIHWLKTNQIPDLNLHLVSSRNRKSIDYSISLDLIDYKKWFDVRLQELVIDVKNAQKRIKQRKKISKKLYFPFATTRPGQKELVISVEEGMKQNKHILLQAPTGLGKTMGVLYPALVESLQRGQKTLYLTPKNSQHQVALDAVKIIQKNGSKIKSLTLTSKKKICMQEEPVCNAQFCQYARDHYTKVTDNTILEKLKKEQYLTLTSFKKMAEKYTVCPYELQSHLIPHSEVVICDYNYVFSPRASANNVAKMGIGESEKPNLVVDEAHNLPARALDYYSASLSAINLSLLKKSVSAMPLSLLDKFHKILDECINIIESCSTSSNKDPHLITPSIEIFTGQEVKLQFFLANYLESDLEISSNDIVLSFVNHWMEFTAALKYASDDQEHYFISFNPPFSEIRITCCDASEMLKPCYLDFSQVTAFSATLKPFSYYSQLIGMQTKSLITQEFTSPFPKERRKIIIIPQISSKYTSRSRNYPRIADVIQKVISIKKGNYFAFFPSFDFLNKVLEIFISPPGFKVHHQTPAMTQRESQQILNSLHEQTSGRIIFAVQGGTFSEGVDYPGELAIGAFIIGTALPKFDWEREKLKSYYEQTYSDGLNYAYTYPAMAKAVQAAGRVIRSETDKGIIVLMDDRFLQANYYNCMPQDWFDTHPNEIVSQAILTDIHHFWEDTKDPY